MINSLFESLKSQKKVIQVIKGFQIDQTLFF